MTAAELIASIEHTGSVALEARGEQIWASEKLPQAVKERLGAHKPEVLQFLRLRQYEQLTASARTLAAFLDDTGVDVETRRPRLPEYEQLLEQIAALQPYADAAGARDGGGQAPPEEQLEIW